MAGSLGEGTTTMNDEPNAPITTLEPREKPGAAQIIDELRESIIAASAMRVFERLARCHNTTECLWENQQTDGRLGERAKDEKRPLFRWPGAPDVRVPIADKLIRWLTMLRMSVFNRGDLRIAPSRASKADDGTGSASDLAGVWQNVMEYFTHVQEWMLSKSYELFSTCVEEFGYAIVLTDWIKKHRNELCTVTLQQLTDVLVKEALAQAENAMLAVQGEPGSIPPATAEAEMPVIDQLQIVDSVQLRLEMMLADRGAPTAEYIGLVQAIDGRMSVGEAKKVIAALRKDSSQPAEYFAPREDGGLLETETLVPGVNCLHPHDMKGNGECDWIAVPRYLTETRLRERARTEKWDKKATEKLVADQRNKFFTELITAAGVSGVPAWAYNSIGVGCVPDEQAMEKLPRWLVIYVWRRVSDDTGKTLVYKAVVNPNMPDDLLLWQATDLEELPILCDTARPVLYAMMSTGVADVVVDKQNFVKDVLDSEGARGQLGSNPPLNRTLGEHVNIEPGVQIYTKRSGSGFNGSEFMEVPGVDVGSIKVMEKVELLIEQYYFRSEDTSDQDKQMFSESIIFKSLRCWKKLTRLLWTHVQENVETLQVSRINGREVQLDARRDQLQGEADIHIGVHLDGYSKDAAEQFVDVMQKIIQNDRGGAIDANEVTNITTQLLAPTYARRLIMNAEQAAGRIADDQENRMTKIATRTPLRYDDHVSGIDKRWEIYSNWMEVPGNVQLAQQDPVVGMLLQKEREYLIFHQKQQTENPAIGRSGVKPNDAEEMAKASA